MLSIQIDDSKIEEAIRQQVASILSKVVATAPTDPRYIFHSVKDLALRLNCSEDTIRAYIKTGKKTYSGRLVKLKTTDILMGEYRVTEADLREFVDCLNLMPAPKALALKSH